VHTCKPLTHGGKAFEAQTILPLTEAGSSLRTSTRPTFNLLLLLRGGLWRFSTRPPLDLLLLLLGGLLRTSTRPTFNVLLLLLLSSSSSAGVY